MTCPNCNDTLWVCESHPNKEAHNCIFCDGAGKPCECNPDAKFPPGFSVILEVKDDG